MSPQPSRQPGKPSVKNGSMQALVKAEKLTQIAFILPMSVLVGWLVGAGLDKWLHQHWIYIAGLVLGVVAGFVQLFRMIAEPGLVAGPDLAAPKGPGYAKDDTRDSEEK